MHKNILKEQDDLTFAFGCDVIQLTQAHLIKKYKLQGIHLEQMCNLEFLSCFKCDLNKSEIELLESLSDFWNNECDKTLTLT